MLSALLDTKSKKKHSQKKETNMYSIDKKPKKKRKEKKIKARELFEVFGDSELPWEDPEKLVQLNQVVSMGSYHSR